ncbi:MAG: tetratricopeptide repeat protein [candidate division WOR-3 bacterium]|nr:tetratricopeptide repeat protein [candidate division WOR-3 bacterium]
MNLDNLYSLKGFNRKRIELNRKVPKDIKNEPRILLQEALLNVHIKEYKKAIRILKENQFHPWEGWTRAHEIWILAHIGEGLKLFKKEEFEGALFHFKEATKYPENLGTGAPAKIVDPRAYYLIGLCYEGEEDTAQAIKFWKKTLEQPIRVKSGNEGGKGSSKVDEETYYKSLALRKLGKKSEANKLLKRLINIGSVEKPPGSRTLYLVGLGYLGLGKEDEAQSFFKRALKEEPDLIEAKWQLDML